MREMMDFETWKHRHGEMVREAERSSLAKSLRRSRERRSPGRTSPLVWELKKIAGRLRKLLRTMRRVG